MAVEPLRVGIDARVVGRGLGVAHYIRELTTELLGHPAIAEIVWFCGPGAELYAPPATRLVSAGRLAFPRLDGRHGRRAAGRAGIDVMHFAANTGWARRGPVPSVVTVHDLIFTRESRRGGSLRQLVGRAYMRHNVPRAAAAAQAVITPSEAAARDIGKAGWPLRAPAQVVPHGHRTRSAERATPPPASAPFVVFGAEDPRKNLALALDAYALARARGLETGLLVLGGAGLTQAQLDRIRGLPRAEVAGYLERAELDCRLAGARALIHPTLAEGFGLPVLDAMAAGVPVVGGLAAASLEVGGEALLRIDPADPLDSLADMMIAIAGDPELWLRASALGLDRAAQFTWAKSAERHCAVYRAAMASQQSR